MGFISEIENIFSRVSIRYGNPRGRLGELEICRNHTRKYVKFALEIKNSLWRICALTKKPISALDFYGFYKRNRKHFFACFYTLWKPSWKARRTRNIMETLSFSTSPKHPLVFL